MENHFLIEIETAHRRGEWERAIAGAARIAQVRPASGDPRWSRLPRLVLARLRALSASRLPATSSWHAGERRSAPGPWKEAVPR